MDLIEMLPQESATLRYTCDGDTRDFQFLAFSGDLADAFAHEG